MYLLGFKGAMEALIKAVKSHEKKHKDLQTALRYLDNTVNAICKLEDATELQECSVCLEVMKPEDTVLTQCGHSFHYDCLCDCLVETDNCPVCRHPVDIDKCTKIKDLSGFASANWQDEGRDKQRKKVGSKVMAIVDLLNKILTEKPGDKIIIFVQWDKIRDSIANAIGLVLGFKPLVLQGSTLSRGKTLNIFQNNKAKQDRILLLSLDKSASGNMINYKNHKH